MNERIERVLVLPAPIEEVWQKSFGSPEALSSWFPEKMEGSFAQGQVLAMTWGEHRCECRLVEIAPPSTLVYQWHPGDAYAIDAFPESELTTVRFSLQPHEGGTRVTILETGFENIPAERRGHVLEMNNEGWDSEPKKLAAYYSDPASK